jgi:hypothetical protein
LVAGADLTKPLFVDVGGAQGLDAQRLLESSPPLAWGHAHRSRSARGGNYAQQAETG